MVIKISTTWPILAPVELVTFAYGQRHGLEIEVAGRDCHVLDMSLLGQLLKML